MVSTAYLTLSYKNGGNTILGFAIKIGARNPDADVSMLIDSSKTICHVDIEMWHSMHKKNRSVEEIRNELEARADNKLAKFKALPTGEISVAAIVCVADSALFHEAFLQSEHVRGFIDGEKFLDRKSRHACVYWLHQTFAPNGDCWLTLSD